MNTIPLLTDESLMPYGKYKDYKMANVPASYLMWLYDNNKCDKAVRWYIERNMDAIQLELKQQDNMKKSHNSYNSR